MSILNQVDSEIAKAIEGELKRQRNGLELIPSENFVSRAVLEALGSVLTNKYSEGYPKERYYGGMEFVDIVESLAIERAKKLFDAEHVNVQPLSGAPANIAVYSAFLRPGDTVLGMDLSHGGHLSHGHPVTYMSQIYNFVRYKTDLKTGKIDMNNVREMAIKSKPKIILAGFSAYSRDLDYQEFKKIADEVGAITMADIAHIAGLIAAGELNNPVPIFDVVTTTTHKTLRGPRGGMIFCKKKYAKMIDKAVFPGFQGGPHENNIAAKAVCFKEAMTLEFKEYAKQVIKNAKTLCAKLKENDFKIVFNKTENHLILTDITVKNLSGKEAQNLLDEVGIAVNKNMIPDDLRSPMDPSGIRLGTPALTTRGFKEEDMEIVGELITKIVHNKNNETIKKEVRKKIKELTKKYPLYKKI
ncbi:MAG: serine hydroxymethyltransferase [Patescibacteria group bacterium]